jgi:hypothetical protein
MYACSAASPSSANPMAHPGHWPLPLKALAVGVGFALFKPLGLAALIYFLVQARRRRFGPQRFGGNSAFDAHRRATLDALAEEERAFAEHRRKEKEARDREAFERFRARPDNTTSL